MKRIPVLTLLTVVLTLWTVAVYAAVPQLINFQGVLKDGSGNPVANGSYLVQFTIYDAAVAGTNLWQETQTVSTVNGLFTVLLGSVSPVPDSVFNDSSRYLGIQVGADPEMIPRQKLASVGFSQRSSEWTSAGENLFRLNGSVSLGTSFVSAKMDVRTNNEVGVSSAVLGSLNGSSVNPLYGYYGSGSNNSTGRAYGVHAYAYAATADAYGGYFFATGGGNSYGVYGSGPTYGVYGNSATYGVVGTGNNRGVTGISSSNGGVGVYGSYGGNSSAWAGWFDQDVKIQGVLNVDGFIFKNGGGFKIDHPTDPANKYLYHSFVESPDMTNLYNGNITLDGKGEATIELPDWFGAVNKDFRYQLTAIGAPGPNLYIAKEISGNEFKISGGTAGMKVSWQVTGIRKDAYAEAHRIPVEEVKTGKEKGKYLHPEEHGAAASLGMHYEEQQKMAAEREKMKEEQTRMEAERKRHEEERAKMEQERVRRDEKANGIQPNK